MAFPAVIALLSKTVANPLVQAGATKLVADVYGKIMGPRERSSGKVTLDILAAEINDLATRDEVIAAFAAFQAEQDQRHTRTGLILMGLAALQVATIVLLMLGRI